MKKRKNPEKAVKKYNSRPKPSKKAIKKHATRMKLLRRLYSAAQRTQLDAIESVPIDTAWQPDGSDDT